MPRSQGHPGAAPPDITESATTHCPLMGAPGHITMAAAPTGDDDMGRGGGVSGWSRLTGWALAGDTETRLGCWGQRRAALSVNLNSLTSEQQAGPWLLWLSGLSASLRTKGSLVLFPVRAHAWVAGQVPNRGVLGRQSHIDVSLPFSPTSSL